MKSDYGRALLLLLLLAPDWALSRTPRHSPDEGAIVQSNSDLAGEEQVEAAGQAQAVEHTELTLPRSISLQRRPVWEVGVGGGYFSGFDYPASSDSNQRFVALPFFIYRTPKFRFGDGGVRAVAIERPTIKLDLSVGGSLNASSEGNSAREGMPNLDFLFEIGPQLEISLFERAMPSGGRVLLRFTSEVRAVLATDFGYVAHRGFVAEAGLGINYRNVRRSGIDLLSAVDVTFADERLQDYFYQVDPAYVNEQRPLYDASGGYLETRWLAGVGLRPLRNLRVFIGAFTGLYQGARNRASPLYETTSSTGFALGVVWTIKSSDAFVDIVDMGSNQ